MAATTTTFAQKLVVATKVAAKFGAGAIAVGSAVFYAASWVNVAGITNVDQTNRSATAGERGAAATGDGDAKVDNSFTVWGMGAAKVGEILTTTTQNNIKSMGAILAPYERARIHQTVAELLRAEMSLEATREQRIQAVETAKEQRLLAAKVAEEQRVQAIGQATAHKDEATTVSYHHSFAAGVIGACISASVVAAAVIVSKK